MTLCTKRPSMIRNAPVSPMLNLHSNFQNACIHNYKSMPKHWIQTQQNSLVFETVIDGSERYNKQPLLDFKPTNLWIYKNVVHTSTKMTLHISNCGNLQTHPTIPTNMDSRALQAPSSHWGRGWSRWVFRIPVNYFLCYPRKPAQTRQQGQLTWQD